MRTLRQMPSLGTSPLRLCIEAHNGELPKGDRALRDLEKLAHLGCRLLRWTRVRSPLEYYESFYRWGRHLGIPGVPILGKPSYTWGSKAPLVARRHR